MDHGLYICRAYRTYKSLIVVSCGLCRKTCSIKQCSAKIPVKRKHYFYCLITQCRFIVSAPSPTTRLTVRHRTSVTKLQTSGPFEVALSARTSVKNGDVKHHLWHSTMNFRQGRYRLSILSTLAVGEDLDASTIRYTGPYIIIITVGLNRSAPGCSTSSSCTHCRRSFRLQDHTRICRSTPIPRIGCHCDCLSSTRATLMARRYEASTAKNRKQA